MIFQTKEHIINGNKPWRQVFKENEMKDPMEEVQPILPNHAAQETREELNLQAADDQDKLQDVTSAQEEEIDVDDEKDIEDLEEEEDEEFSEVEADQEEM